MSPRDRAEVSADDVQRARLAWRQRAPAAFRLLLDASLRKQVVEPDAASERTPRSSGVTAPLRQEP